MFRVSIIGADSINDADFCCKKCINILRAKNEAGEKLVINSTGDSFVERFTQFFGIDCQYFMADFEEYGKEAYSIRNDQLFENSDAFIIFDGGSKDASVMADMVKRRDLPYRIIKK